MAAALPMGAPGSVAVSGLKKLGLEHLLTAIDAALVADPLIEMPSTVRVDKKARTAYEQAAAEQRAGQFAIEQRNGNAVLLPDERPTGLGKAWR